MLATPTRPEVVGQRCTANLFDVLVADAGESGGVRYEVGDSTRVTGRLWDLEISEVGERSERVIESGVGEQPAG